MKLTKLTTNIILEVANRPDYYTSSRFCKKFSHVLSYLNTLISNLEKEGFIIRRQKDGKNKSISLTNKGHEMHTLIVRVKSLGGDFR